MYSQRNFYRYSPYPNELYRKMSDLLRNDEKFIYPEYTSRVTETNKINIFNRHDIDTLCCLNNISVLVDIDIEFGVSSPCYIRVDEEEYSLVQARKTVIQYAERGVEFGLHTVCYIHDNYLKAFESETSKFISAFGYRPKSFTVHGLGEYRYDTRRKFYIEISNRLHDFGYDFSDCLQTMRIYHYVVEDCHWNQSQQCRFIYDDFLTLPKTINPGMNVLILTHPCYWVK